MFRRVSRDDASERSRATLYRSMTGQKLLRNFSSRNKCISACEKSSNYPRECKLVRFREELRHRTRSAILTRSKHGLYGADCLKEKNELQNIYLLACSDDISSTADWRWDDVRFFVDYKYYGDRDFWLSSVTRIMCFAYS